MKMTLVLAGVLSLLATGVFADGPAVCRVENGQVVVTSPFDLEFGSAEYARILADRLYEAKHTYGVGENAVVTPCYSVNARLEKPIWGYEYVMLSFDEGKRFRGFEFFRGSDEEKLSISDCSKKVREIVADLEKRFGVELSGDDGDEEEARESVAELMEREGITKDTKNQRVGTGFGHYSGYAERNGRDIRINVSGTLWNTGDCGVRVSVSADSDDGLRAMECADYVRVVTNTPSASKFKLPLTEAQKKAHAEAAGLRAALLRMFGVDLDRPELEVDLQKVDLKMKSGPEWTKLEIPVAGMTERKVNMSLSLSIIPFGTCALRYVYEGDASEADRAARAKEFLTALEKEAGAPIPAVEKASDKEKLAELFGGEGVPAFGDTRAVFRADVVRHFTGRVGDLVVSVESAPPRYVQKGGGYEVSLKGAVVVNIMQSPFISGSRSGKADK